jgi:cyclopropane fatty-acyl-phospholipid synthase-like methyltransferase
MMRARIITTATRLGVFEALASGSLEYHDLAVAVGTRGDGLYLMLEALVGFGYLRHRGNRYENSRMVRKYLVSSSPYFLGNMILFQEDADARTRSLATVIRTGQVDSSYEAYLDEDPERWRRYVLGMRETARLSTQEVIAKVPVPTGARRLLDLGGSHGLHACSFCECYPKLQAVVFDRPGAVGIGREIIASLPIRDRITFQEGDMWRDSFGENYDILLLFAILHLFSPERNRHLLARVANAILPGGILVIADFLADRLPAEWSASFSLGIRCFFGEGQVYDQSAIRHWLSEAGFERVHVRHLRNPASLVIATKSGRRTA